MASRLGEFVVCFGVVPVTFAVLAHRFNYRGAMAPILWLVSLGLGLVLYRDPAFDRAVLWRLPLEHPYVRTIALRFMLLSAVLLLWGRWLTPERFLWFPRQRPRFWLVFLVAYPLLSAVPQGLIWRVFLAHRYEPLFAGPLGLVIAGAAAFSLAHLAFWNLTAIAMTAVGGALFLATYLTTHSMLLAALEHGAYGVVAFSAGFGAFLYRGGAKPSPARPAAA